MPAVHTVEARPALAGDELAAVDALVAAAATADDSDLVEERHRLRPADGGLVAWLGGAAIGFAKVARAGDGWSVATVVDPGHRAPASTVGPDLMRRAAAVVGDQGGGHVQMWVTRPGPAWDLTAAAAGLRPGRALYQMRRPLPVDADLADPEPLPTRPFVPGRDEAAWLGVNNRAFAWHPEQGGWELATIEAEQSAPWFDPAGFLLHEEGGVLRGFCWTKVHARHTPPLGEIYVIAVDPASGQRGLGRRLVLAGLDHLARSGLTVGMLYVDALNVPAVKLYVDLRFVVHHVDLLYEGDVPAAMGA